MNNKPPLESTLEKIGSSVSLSSAEKKYHRDELVAFMQKNSSKPIPSPFSVGLRYAALFSVAIIVVSGGAGLSIARSALPGDTLYLLKLHVTEPIQSVLTFSREEKVDFELVLVSQRLQEFSRVASRGSVDSDTTDNVVASLKEHIANVEENIELLSEEGRTQEAIQTNAELQSLLAAHTQILDAVEEKHGTSEAITVLSSEIETSLEKSVGTETALITALETEPKSEDTTVLLDTQHKETLISLEKVQKTYEQGMFSDAEDREAFENTITGIVQDIERASLLQNQNKPQEAFLLYTELQQKLATIETLFKAEEATGIDVDQAELLPALEKE